MRRLGNRKLYPDTRYLGDKNIVWKFLSAKDRDGFIRNRLIWEEFLSSMGSWSKAVTPQTRLSWFEFRGVPLDCWCEEFFSRLGWAIGLTCPESIKVVTGKYSFSVSATEVQEQVGIGWISSKLGMHMGIPSSDCNDSFTKERGHSLECASILGYTKGCSRQKEEEGGGKANSNQDGDICNNKGQSYLGPSEKLGNFFIDLRSGPVEEPDMGLTSIGPSQNEVERLVVDVDRDCTVAETQTEHMDQELVLYNARSTNPSVDRDSGSFSNTEEMECAEAKAQARKEGIVMANSPMKQNIGRLKENKSFSSARWNLEVEVAKVIEKEVELGHIIPASSVGGTKITREVSREQTGTWSLSQEVAKVIEMGVALGIDFNGEELEVRNEVARRVTEDEEYLKSTKKKSKSGSDRKKKGGEEESKLNYFDNRVIRTLGGHVLTRGIGIIGGDFNAVLDSHERKGGVGCSVSIRNFRKFVDHAKVVDLPMQGMSFMWSNNMEAESWARLDRFLCDPVVLSWFPGLVQKGLSRSVSDHNPVGIGEPIVDWGPKPFRMFNGWIDDKDMMDKARKSWKLAGGHGNSGRKLLLKTKAVKKQVKAWVKERA
ncbi:hypothetical protein Dsin_013679 [Dipteronia sinensis]|uniref:DUF4283 domain-containing protein n=1 Tax=Dipteronia sinensis TaxID=43782 RepID=A0AAE0ALM6_9ROSI|nr:hypothetical protein Dsin_013679 [Dipteronia sinensis]